ncbi:hypothetical protein [Haladaptatus sp. GCM10025893]|uniref:hypothetical protein n=1 Tax=Haladaptatus sp. GCM10025893 TaxID=3252659 RepID=UPI00361A85D4
MGAGIAMSVGTLTFYRSLSAGGGSVATAIAGLYFLVTTVHEMVVLGTPPKPTKVVGIALAGAAIVFLVQ